MPNDGVAPAKVKLCRHPGAQTGGLPGRRGACAVRPAAPRSRRLDRPWRRSPRCRPGSIIDALMISSGRPRSPFPRSWARPTTRPARPCRRPASRSRMDLRGSTRPARPAPSSSRIPSRDVAHQGAPSGRHSRSPRRLIELVVPAVTGLARLRAPRRLINAGLRSPRDLEVTNNGWAAWSSTPEPTGRPRKLKAWRGR